MYYKKQSAKDAHTEQTRAAWLPAAMQVAKDAGVKLFAPYMIAEAYQDPSKISVSDAIFDTGLVDPSTGSASKKQQRYYGVGGPGGAKGPYDNPQDRMAYCAILNWARVNNYVTQRIVAGC